MEFFAHDEQGRIWQTGHCPSNMLNKQAVPGCTVRIGHATIDGHYWCSRAGLQAMPARPTQAHVFDYLRKAWVLDEARAWDQVRAKRDQLMVATDWRALRANEQGVALAPEWLEYRQALRDVTMQSDPLRIEWPQAPS